jgi:hypothetical protein
MAPRHLVKDLVGRRPGCRERGLQRYFGSLDQLEARDIGGSPIGDAPVAGLRLLDRSGHGDNLVEVEIAAGQAVPDEGVEKFRWSRDPHSRSAEIRHACYTSPPMWVGSIMPAALAGHFGASLAAS